MDFICIFIGKKEWCEKVGILNLISKNVKKKIYLFFGFFWNLFIKIVMFK